MNIYKGLLFLHGHVFDPRILEDVPPATPARAAPADAPVRPARSDRGARPDARRDGGTRQAAPAAGCCA